MRTKSYRRRRSVRPRRKGIYRRRRYGGRRRFGRRFSRRILRIPTQLQQVCLKKFKWINETSKQLTIVGGTYGSARQININNLYQCDSGSTPPEAIPRLQELCALYLFCKVYACKVTARFYIADKSQTGATVTAPLKVYIAAIPYGQTLPSLAAAASTKDFDRYIEGNPFYCTKAILGSDSNSPGMVTLTKYFKVSSLLGNKKEYDALSIWDQPIPTGSIILNAGPTANTGVNVGVIIANQTTIASNIFVGCDISCVYYTKFWGNKFQVE